MMPDGSEEVGGGSGAQVIRKALSSESFPLSNKIIALDIGVDRLEVRLLNHLWWVRPTPLLPSVFQIGLTQT